MHQLTGIPAGELTSFKWFVRILWVVLVASVGLYCQVLYLLPVNRGATPAPVVVQALTLAAVGTAGAVLFVRFNRIPAILSRLPFDAAALVQLRTLHILSYVLAESVAFFGIVLRFLGAPRGHALWFLIGSAALFLVCYPRSPETPLGLPPQ